MPTLTLTTLLAAPPEACFDLSLDVDAHMASMAASGERAVGGVTSGVMGPGDEVSWRARHLGVPLRMTSRITAYERPHRFVDEQVRGPFRSWWHEHRFVAVPEPESEGGGTRMVDVVRFTSPAGPLGRLVDRLLLETYMMTLLRDRNTHLRDALADPRPRPGA